MLTECGKRTQGLVTLERLRAAGLSRSTVARAAQRGLVVRVHRRLYAVAALPPWTGFVVTQGGPAAAYVCHARAALLSIGAGAVAERRTAAALYGWPMLVEPARTIEVAVPHGSRRTQLPRVRVAERRSLRRLQVVALQGTDPVPVTDPVQTVVDCCTSLPLLEAVVICDSGLRARQVAVEELARAARALPGVRAAARVRRVLELCDPESGSVLETVLRVRMVLAGISGFATQQVIRDHHGRHVLRVDFCFAAAGLVVEVDGQKWHQDPERDRGLDNALAALGMRVLRYSWAEVVHDPERVLAQIRQALGATGDSQSYGSAGVLAA